MGDFEKPEVGGLDSWSISSGQIPVRLFLLDKKQPYMAETTINGLILLRTLVNKYCLSVKQGT